MQENDFEIDPEKMHTPSHKLLVTTPMAAIMVSGKANSEWADLLESIGPIYSSAAEDTGGEVNEALRTVAFMLQGGDRLIRKYFENEELTFDRMMELSATGADVWICKLSDGEIAKPDAIKLFKAIQAGLVGALGDLRDENEMIDQLIRIQDKAVEHIASLN
ncbi:hypothetical protein TspCOW1_26040 [Thiohalobacter sp. COW1]|uniref:Xylanase/chitin deacetylase n=1 Tax=Thiohalobacter thiocyanaticus TaxID=585455 RepID=A0A1Z4VLP1_9GAMM|nr:MULTISPECIES: hypothetical protein [Thiohalobacter]BAZ92516.1 xylanase/chitin deacetylase [Thiohalobacter thiocyanaticus]BCO32501.1 hypothetical protein TspCOW1_26040 [Thiohalobacter sp. COW1]